VEVINTVFLDQTSKEHGSVTSLGMGILIMALQSVIEFVNLARGACTYSSPNGSIGCSSHHKRPHPIAFK
jgi:hypothetical protein